MNNRRLLIFLCVSIFLHLSIFAALWIDKWSSPKYSASDEITAISIQIDQHTPNPDLSGKTRAKDQSQIVNTSSSVGDTSGKSSGSAIDPNSKDSILSLIRKRIEENKYYPAIAKKREIEGSPEVSFKITKDGSLEYLKLKNSSGSDILDKAALETVQRATPLPYYSSPISLSLNYTLD
ncbi:energy transducer TonB [bacterium]|nr:energy transducer TonB [bacterium]